MRETVQCGECGARTRATDGFCSNEHKIICELRDEISSLHAQIDKLTAFVSGEIPGEPSKSEGAVDTIIRCYKALRATAAPAVSETDEAIVGERFMAARSHGRFALVSEEELATLRADRERLEWILEHCDMYYDADDDANSAVLRSKDGIDDAAREGGDE